MKILGQALIITAFILQTYCGTPFWLTICLVLGGFGWMEGYELKGEDEYDESI